MTVSRFAAVALAVARYRLSEMRGLRRWWLYPPLFFLGAWLAGDPLAVRMRAGAARFDALDLVLNNLADSRILVVLLGGGMLALTGDAVHRSERSGALAYLLIRCRRRGLWWLGEAVAVGVTALALVLLFVLCCAVAGAVRLGFDSSSALGANWSFSPGIDQLPRSYASTVSPSSSAPAR